MKNSTFTPTGDQIKAAQTTFAAMAYAEAIRPDIVKIQTDLLNFWQFEPAPKYRTEKYRGEHFAVITDPERAFLLDEQDAAIYYAELNEAYKKAGFEVKPNYCPLLIAESLQRDAERLLIESFEPITRISLEMATRSLKNYKNLVELTLRLMAKFMDTKEIMRDFAK